MCTEAVDYFRPSKPHSGKLCSIRVIICLGAVVEGDSDGVSAVNNLQWTGKV